MLQAGQRTDCEHIAGKEQRGRQPVKQRRRDDTLLIVNAVITEVDTGKQTIMVKDNADESTLGEECLIDCSTVPMVYCDFATQKVTRISFEELQVNDKVIVSIRISEMEKFRSGGNEENTLKVEQLQLYTQRPAE